MFNLTRKDIVAFQKAQYPSDIDFCAVNIFEIMQKNRSGQAYSEEKIQQFCDKIRHKEMQAKMVQQNSKLINSVQRQAKLRSLKYWDDFRIRRQAVIDRYIELKKVQRCSEYHLKHMYLDIIVRHIRKLISKTVRERQYQMAWKFIKAKLIYKIKMIEYRYGSFSQMNQNRIKFSFMLSSTAAL